MLVLYATFTSSHPSLNSLIDEQTLRRLHKRTLNILRENETVSPVLKKDWEILEHVGRRVFSSNYQINSQESSFSSR
jgi:hypothetical protein